MKKYILFTSFIVLVLLLVASIGSSTAEQQTTLWLDEEAPFGVSGSEAAPVLGSRTGGSIDSVGLLLNQLPNAANGIFSDASCDFCGGQQAIAENFALAEAESIAEIVLWSGYFPGDVPIDPDVITVIFHEDDAGLPGTAIYTDTNVTSSRLQTGLVLFGVHEWMHVLILDTPVTLGPGSYWVEIYNDTGFGTDDFFWETGNPDTLGNGLPGSAFAFTTPGSSWNIQAVELALQLITLDDLPTLYGAATGLDTGAGPSSLYAIDQRTGAATLIGPIGFNNVTGLAFLGDGRLVGSAHVDIGVTETLTATSILIEIDLATGAGTLIGNISDNHTGCGRMPDISYDPTSGTLYGYGDQCFESYENDSLVTIDPVTGEGTLIGPTGYTDGGNGMDADPLTGIIYATPSDDGSLITIDPVTGVGSEVPGSAGMVPNRINALDFHPGSGVLYGSWNENALPNKLVIISTGEMTTTTTVVGETILGLDAIAFAAPRIQVTPTSLSSTQAVDEVTTHTLTISNAGDQDLVWEFMDTPVIAGWPGYTPPEVTLIESPGSNSGVTIANQPGSGESINLGPGPKLLYAPSQADDPLWRASLAALISGTVDYYDASAGTPTLAELLAYDAVLTYADVSYADNVAFGDTLADYVDAGGQVILSAFTTFTSGFYLDGRIMTDAYAPVSSPTGSNHYTLDQYAGDGTTYLHNGVDFYQCTYRDELALQGSGQQDGSYLDGEIAVSYRPDYQVVHINGLDVLPLTLASCNGDYQLIIANALRRPLLNDCGVPWASTVPISGTTSPGAATQVDVAFDSTGLLFGVHTGSLCLASNDPVEPLITIPLTLTVTDEADLFVTKTAPISVTIGDHFTYDLEYGNLGLATAFSATITDTLPTGVEFVSASDPACAETGNVVTCDLGDLPAMLTGTIQIEVVAVATGPAVNEVVIASLAPDPDPDNNADMTETLVEPRRFFLPIVFGD